MRHAFVDRGFNYDSHFLPGLIGSKDSAEAYFSAFAGPLPEKASRSGPVALRAPNHKR